MLIIISKDFLPQSLKDRHVMSDYAQTRAPFTPQPTYVVPVLLTVEFSVVRSFLQFIETKLCDGLSIMHYDKPSEWWRTFIKDHNKQQIWNLLMRHGPALLRILCAVMYMRPSSRQPSNQTSVHPNTPLLLIYAISYLFGIRCIDQEVISVAWSASA